MCREVFQQLDLLALTEAFQEPFAVPVHPLRVLFQTNFKQGGWEERPAEIAPRTGADPSNLDGVMPAEGADAD